MIDWGPIILSLELAFTSTDILFLIGITVAYCLAFRKNWLSSVAEAAITLPLVLPPTVLGFYLLLAFSPTSAVGAFLERTFGLRLAFSYTGLVLASTIYSLPFMIQPIQSAFKSLPSELREASATMGKSWTSTLFSVLLPNIKPGLVTGCVLAFAHTLGEFGVVLMIGGNIPDKTRVASIAIFDEVETLNYSAAHVYSGILLGLSFIILLVVYLLNNRQIKFGLR